MMGLDPPPLGGEYRRRCPAVRPLFDFAALFRQLQPGNRRVHMAVARKLVPKGQSLLKEAGKRPARQGYRMSRRRCSPLDGQLVEAVDCLSGAKVVSELGHSKVFLNSKVCDDANVYVHARSVWVAYDLQSHATRQIGDEERVSLARYMNNSVLA